MLADDEKVTEIQFPTNIFPDVFQSTATVTVTVSVQPTLTPTTTITVPAATVTQPGMAVTFTL